MGVQKKILALLVVVTLCAGCALSIHPLVGALYTDNKGPLLVTANKGANKVGVATSTMIFGFCTGDSSIEAAAAQGGITKIMAVDTKIKSVLGVYLEFETIVRGN
jgi:hypothetical protein